MTFFPIQIWLKRTFLKITYFYMRGYLKTWLNKTSVNPYMGQILRGFHIWSNMSWVIFFLFSLRESWKNGGTSLFTWCLFSVASPPYMRPFHNALFCLPKFIGCRSHMSLVSRWRKCLWNILGTRVHWTPNAVSLCRLGWGALPFGISVSNTILQIE